MTILDRAAGALRPPAPDVRPAAPTAAALAALQAAGTSFVVVLVPVVVTWLVTADDRAAWTGVLRLGAVLWLLGHHVAVAVPGGALSFAPLGLLAVCAVTLVLAGRRTARLLDPLAERIEAGTSRAAPSAPGPLAATVFVAVYGVLGALAALLATSAQARPDPLRAAAAAALLAVAGGGAGVLVHLAGGVRAVPGLVASWLPAAVRPALRPAAVALAVQVAAGAVLLVVALVAQHDRVLGLHRALDPGLAGGTVLVVAQLTVVPNLAVWAAAFLAGPGFAVGAGTSVTPAAVSLGALPAVPVLGALPVPGTLPGAALLAVAVPLAAGAAAGRLVVRARGGDAGPWAAVRDTVVVGLLAGAGFALLCWLAAGGIGPGRLGTAGPVPWLAGTAFAAEVGAGALLYVGARAALPALRRG